MKGRSLGKRLALVSAAVLTAFACAAAAQPASESANEKSPRGSSLTSRLSPSVAMRLLRSSSPEDRLRGIRRLGSQRDYAAVQVLLQAVEDDPGLAALPTHRLEVVRAFAPFASREPVRRLLVTWATDTTSRGRSAGPLGDLARDQAAMALAATSNARAIEQLVLAVMDGGAAGERARSALIAHPPRNIEPLLLDSSLESAEVVEILGHLGDLRALPKLRRIVGKADIDVQVAAAVALARLGDASGAKLARDWLSQDGSTHALRIGAAETLTLVRDPLAPRAIAVLLADPVTRERGLELAERAPTPQLAPTLAGLLTIARGRDRLRVLMALARAGGPLAAKTLGGLLAKSPVDADAAFALAHCRDPNATSRIEALLANPATRRTGARAGLARVVALGEEPSGLQDNLEALAASRDDSDRTVGVFGLVLTGRESVEVAADSKDVVTVMAGCRASLSMDASARQPCIRRLAGAKDPALRDALAGALVGNDATVGVSTNALLAWAESSRVSAPVFGRALGPRDDTPFRTRIKRLLDSGDPAMRSQVALGLGRSPEASAATLLSEAYAFEVDPWVRRAIVTGLAARQSAVGRHSLELAAQLDPDSMVRTLARCALSGRRVPAPGRGGQMLWLRVEDSSGVNDAGMRPVRVVMSSGFATVVVTAPDGQVLVPGLTPGAALVRAAGPTPSKEKPER